MRATREKRVKRKHLNPMGMLHGGELMKWIDEAGGDAAHCHAERFCVTAHVDSFEFLRPVLPDQTVIMKASVTRTWNTSLEVAIRAEARNEDTGQCHLVASAYYVYVGLDEDRKPIKIDEFVPYTEEEKREWAAAGQRRDRRLREKNQSK